MTEEQKQAVIDRDYNRMLALGGNMYFLAKIFATDGKSFQYAAALMTGMSQEDYARMMLEGGRAYVPSQTEGGRVMARITAGISCSHVPAIGAAIDLGKTQEPYWAPLFAGFEFSKQWMAAEYARRGLPGLQRSRHRVQPRDHSRRLPSAAPRNSRPRMKAGARGRCPWCVGLPSSPRTSPRA